MMRLIALAALSVSLLAPMSAEEPVSIRQLKSAFLYKFSIFLDWPDNAFENATSPIVIGILGDKELTAATEQTVAGREVRGRSFQVRSYAWAEDVEPDVHILYLDPDFEEHGRLKNIFKQVGAKAPNAFIVSEGNETITRGAHLSFSMENARLRFLINLNAATAAQIRISSKLLRLATIVDKGREGR